MRFFGVTLLLAGIASAWAALPPSITSASPNPIDAGGPYFEMTVTGTGFIAGSVMNLGHTPLRTTFVSSTQLRAAITPELRRFSGEYDLTVGNPDGFISGPYQFLISPVIATVTPVAVLAGSSAVDITVRGIGFILSDVLVLTVSGQRIALPATLINSATLTATVPASALAIAAAATIEVFDPRYGDVSAQLPFPIRAPPVITSASPSPIDAGGPYFLMTITGSNFAPGAAANLAGAAVGTTFVSSTQLQVAITPEIRALSGTFDLTVTEPGGIRSAAFAIAISPVLASVSPPSAISGSPPLPITVAGIGFTRNNVLAFTASGQTSRLATTYVNSTTLSAVIPPGGLSTPVTAGLQVLDTVGPEVSASLPFAVRIAPVITSASPNLLDAGGPGLVMTVNGSGFVSGSVLNWAGNPLGTTFVSSTRLTATITPALRALCGGFSLTLTDPASMTSAAYPITVAPVLLSVNPASAVASGPPVTITATGVGFTRNNGLTFNSSALTTTYVSPTTLTAVIPADRLGLPGAATVQVIDSTGSDHSLTQPFTIATPVPTLFGLSPNVVTAGPGFTLAVSGSGFFSRSAVQWNRSPLVTSFISNTQLNAQVSASLLLSAGIVAIRISNPGGAVSIEADLTINAVPAASLTSLVPSSVIVGSPGFQVTVNGSGFVAGSIVLWNGSPLATTYVSATQLRASAPASLLTDSVGVSIAVSNPGGSISRALTFLIESPRPTISGITPSSAPAGASTLSLTIAGANFAPYCVVRWDGSPLDTAFTSATQVTATVPVDFVARPGPVAITVVNPSGMASTPVTFDVSVSTPTLTALNPASVAAGSGALTLTVSGFGFTPSAAVIWNGNAAVTTYVSATQLTAAVPAELTKSAGAILVSVMNPGGLISRPVTFTVMEPPPSATVAAVLNAFSGSPSVAPGSLISIYGTNLAAGAAAASSVPLPNSLNGNSVTIGGVFAPLFFVSPGQINAQVPFVTLAGSATLLVRAGTLQSEPVRLEITATAPGILTSPGDTQVVALNCASGALISATSPATPGQCVTIYLTGQGAVFQPVPTGAPAPADPLSLPLAEVLATVADKPASVAFAGLAPGFVGLLQVNLVIPDVPAGDQALIVTIGGVPANGAVLPVQIE